MQIKIIFSKHFKKKYKNLSPEIQNQFKEKIEILLKKWLTYPWLRIHKLNWYLSMTFSLSINMNFRALFYKTSKNWEIILDFFNIWNHDIYNK